MKLTDRILLAYAEQRLRVQRTRQIGSSGLLEGAMVLSREEEMESGWIYLVDHEVDVHKMPRGLHCLLISTCRQQASFPAGVALMETQEDSARALEMVSRCQAYYARWERELEKIQFGLGSVEEMLRASKDVFANPILLFRSDLTLQTAVYDRIETPEVEAFLDEDDRMEFINALLQDERYRPSRSKSTCFWGPDYIVGFRSVNWNVRKNGNLTYCLSVVEDGRRLSGADEDLLEVLGFYVRYALYNREGRGSRKDESLRKILLSILTDRTLDYMEASRQLQQLDWREEHEYLCLVYQLTYLDQTTLPTASICNYMEEQYSCCSCFPFRNDIVTFFDLSISKLTYEEILTRLKPFIRDSYLKAGFSRIVTGHMNLRRQFVQASIAIDVGGRKNPYLWIHYFDQNAMPYILEQMTRKLPAGMLAHEGLLRLWALDAAKGTAYVETLRTYLDSAMNAVQTARALFIHRSTLLYRLDKIKEVLESDLDDADERLYLALSIRLLESRENG